MKLFLNHRIFFLLITFLGSFFPMQAIRLFVGPEIHLSTPGDNGYNELSRKIDDLRSEIEDQEVHRGQVNPMIMHSHYEENLLKDQENEGQLKNIEDVEDLKKQYQKEAKENAEDSEVLTKMSKDGVEEVDLQHAENELLRKKRNKDNEMLKDEINQTEQEEEELRNFDEQEEHEKESPLVTSEDMQLENTAADAYDTAQKTLNDLDSFSSKIVEDEQDKETQSLEELNENTKDKLEKTNTLDSLSDEHKGSAEESKDNTSLPVVKGVSDQPCPCIEEMMEQPCPDSTKSQGYPIHEPCDKTNEKYEAENELDQVMHEANDVVDNEEKEQEDDMI